MAKNMKTLNPMYKALVNAHNTCNGRAISKQDALDLGIGEATYTVWCTDVEALRTKVCAYIEAKYQFMAGASTLTQSQVNKLRKACESPMKTLAFNVYETPFTDEKDVKLNLDLDVESAIGFCEKFIKTGLGTQLAFESEQLFRKAIESYLGVKIAKNSILTDEERDIIENYHSACSKVKSHKTKAEEASKQAGKLRQMLTEATSDEVKTVIEGLIEPLDAENKAEWAKAEAAEQTAKAQVGAYNRVMNRLNWAEAQGIKIPEYVPEYEEAEADEESAPEA